MSKTTTTVKIATDSVNCYATIVRSMITATTAALRLGDNKMAGIFMKLKDTANNGYNEALLEHSKKVKAAE